MELRAALDACARTGYTAAFANALRAAATRDDAWALVVLAMFHREGCRDRRGRALIPVDARAERRLLERAAELGHAAGMCGLADILSGRGKGGDMHRAIRLYRRSFARGYSTAALNLAITYQILGRHAHAVGWFRRALALGDDSAELPLAYAELYGIGTRRDPARAVARLERVARGAIRVADIERERALLLLADAHRDGWLLPRDHRAAVRLWREASRIGSAAARGLLADEGISARARTRRSSR